MRWVPWLFALCLLVTVVSSDSSEESQENEDELPLAEACHESCVLPDCRCSSSNIPGGLAPRDTPQFVLVTFDDGVNILNQVTYQNHIYNRINSNGCPAGCTFFVNHEYTNYQIVNELYNQGFEIALHSISHQTPQSYWAEASAEDMRREFADQRIQMSHFANIPYEAIQGVRIPFLQLAGNNSFAVMAESGLVYDSTWPTISFVDPGLWPYTLKHSSIQDCVIGPCPSASIPEVWVSPMISWVDLEGIPCSMADSCFFRPDLDDEEAWFRFILTNFERHYLGNRAPFGYYVHEWFLSANPAILRAFVRFMDMINSMHDVFMVNNSEVIDWVKNPVPVDEYKRQPCRTNAPRNCPAASCGPLHSEHNNLDYWMQICNVCPRTYPWLGNPLGQ